MSNSIVENLKKPLEVMCIFDNEGVTLDRYTIGMLFNDDTSYVVYSCEDPTRSNGIWSHNAVTLPPKTDDKQIDWNDLPLVVQQSLLGYFFGWTYKE